MKKQYTKPAIQAIKITAERILAGSPDTSPAPPQISDDGMDTDEYFE